MQNRMNYACMSPSSLYITLRTRELKPPKVLLMLRELRVPSGALPTRITEEDPEPAPCGYTRAPCG